MILTRTCKPDGPRAVVLCAGASRRMGPPKGLLSVEGVPLVRAHVEAFASAGIATVVVLGRDASAHLDVLPVGVRVVLNPRWTATDMATSAWLALQDLEIALVTPVDVPPARPETIRRLLDTPGSAVPTWQGHEGHPIKLAPPHVPGRLDLRIAGATRVAVDDPDCIRNLNTPEAWAAWRDEKAKRPRYR